MWKFLSQGKNRAKSRGLAKFNNRILGHILLAALSIVLTVVLIFAMAAAWYSNVVEVASVQLTAEPWGFSGEVTVGSEILSAAPGDSGIVELSVNNPSDSVIEVTVGASKSSMVQEMQQRIYFYVEFSSVQNGELVERTYLSQSSGYSYTVLPERTLTISESGSNAAPIYWMWVYDLLGYYVQGQWTDSSFVASEYLMPVEYDYDNAVFDDDGYLIGVDAATDPSGETTYTTVEGFVAEITAQDGHSGSAEYYSAGWYKISVDDNGSGVWLHLCSKAEIEAANQYDTKLGTDAAQAVTATTYTANLLVTGQQKALNTASVSTTQELTDALSSGEYDMVELANDVTVSSTITLSDGVSLILDLNGNTLSKSTSGGVIRANEGSTVIVMDGTITGVDSSDAIVAIGADVTLDSVTLSGAWNGISVADYAGSGTDSQVKITGCEFSVSQCAVFVCGNGSESSGKTVLVIEDSVLYGEYAAISGNGTVTGTGYWGTEVLVSNSTLTGGWAGIYQPQQDSVMTIINSTVEGYTGIAIKGGTIYIQDSSVTGTGEAADPAYSGGGWTDTGDGVYMECNYSWDKAVYIYGESTISSVNNQAIRKYAADDEDAETGTIVVTGGTFTGAAASTVAEFVPDGYTITGDGTTRVTVSGG